MAPVAEPKKEKETSDKKEDTKSKDGTKKEEEPELVSAFHKLFTNFLWGFAEKYGKL